MSPVEPRNNFAGIPQETIQRWFSQAQSDRHGITTGHIQEMVAYGQGDGTKTVTYTRADLTEVHAYVAALGAARHVRNVVSWEPARRPGMPAGAALTMPPR